MRETLHEKGLSKYKKRRENGKFLSNTKLAHPFSLQDYLLVAVFSSIYEGNAFPI